MEQQKKRGRPRKNPVAAVVEAPKKRGRPAGTRIKHRVTVQSVKQNWEHRYKELSAVNDAAKDEIIRLSVELNEKDRNIETSANRIRAAELHIKNIEKDLKVKEVRELKLFGIIEYLEDKVKNAITNN